MSGVGKSTVLLELARRGFSTIDTDDDGWIHIVDGEPLWREPLIDALLRRPREAPLFVQGTVANQGRFYDRFDAIALLSAPVDVVFDRLAQRTNNPYGKTRAERERIANDIAEVEPLLRQAATHEIATTRPLAEVVDTLIDIARKTQCGLLGLSEPRDPDGGEPVRSIEVVVGSVNDVGIVDLLTMAVGGNPSRLRETVQRYRDDPAITLLVAVETSVPIGIAGYIVRDNEIRLLHIATAHSARRIGVGRLLLAAVCRAGPGTLPLIAETDSDGLGFYTAAGFTIVSLGERYPGVERFRARLG
jgi:GNAT superfamily N-acetyltransferase